ncbi:hypothetical protein IFM89_039479 [Coptis chinensis]|uniref:BED-type domain-containing protein n=1 Tax=Coptis chinensis TaxID=261450 RepID=A0A835IIY9_9MAGN|nr:hypothetical protein IFM89_039479 [Coptis chinensis]
MNCMAELLLTEKLNIETRQNNLVHNEVVNQAFSLIHANGNNRGGYNGIGYRGGFNGGYRGNSNCRYRGGNNNGYRGGSNGYKGRGISTGSNEMSSRASNEPSIGSGVDATTTTTTTSMKRKSDDIAWEWGECRDPNNRNFVWYLLCDKRMSGGINRLKEHLVHKKGNVMSCPNVTIEIQKKVNATLQQVRKKKLDKTRIQGILKIQDEDVDEVKEQEIFNGGGNRSQGISIGGAKKRKVIDNVKGPLDRLLPTDKFKQITLDKTNPHKQALKKITWNKITKEAIQRKVGDSDSDPILLKDENDDWIIPSETQLEEFLMEGDDLTWEQVRAVRGANIDVGPSTRNRTRNSVTIHDEADEDDEVDLEENGEGSRYDDVNESAADDIDIDIEAGDDQ